MKMIKFNVAAINQCTETEGPFKRLTVWFQGCDIHCEGCGNAAYQALEIKNLMTLDELIDVIRDAKAQFGIEGVTYTGGEPTLQQGLPRLTEQIKAFGLGIIAFTGHRYEDVKDFLSGCDVVLDGPYDRRRPETKRKLLGSENQRILCLTDRYRDVLDWFHTNCRTVEVNVGTSIFANGDHF